MKFKKYLNEIKQIKNIQKAQNIKEETTSADISTVDTKLDMVKRQKHLSKGKKCKLHKQINCEICEAFHEDWF